MKSFSLCVFTLMAAAVGSNARPQYGQASPQQSRNPSRAHAAAAPASGGQTNQQDLPRGCRIVFKDIQTIVEIEREDVVCTPYQERVCDTKYRQVCNPYTTKKCNTVYKKVCEKKYNRVCSQLFRDVPEDYHEDECKDELTRVCDSTWVVAANGDKVWQEDPTTCREIPETKCRQVKKTRTNKEPYTDCQNVPYQACRNVPEEKCQTVNHDGCEQEAYDDCHNVDRKRCENVHTKTPQSKTESKAVRVCDGSNDVVPYAQEGAGAQQGNQDAEVIISSSRSKDTDGPRSGVTDSYDGTAFVFSS